MSRSIGTAVLFVIFAIVATIVGGLVWLTVEIGNRVLAAVDALPWLIPVALLLIIGASTFALVYVLINGSVAVSRAAHLKSRQVHPHNGLYPVMYHTSGYVNVNGPKVQELAVMHQGRRATAATVQRVLDWNPESFPDLPPAAEILELPPPAPQPLTTDQVVDVDPRTSPHWLLVGSTGSGKTVASYAILDQMCRRNPAQVIVCEPGGVNWKNQATATKTIEIARTIGEINVELERRQELLRQSEYDHVRDLDMPYLVLVAEEIETLLDDLKLQDSQLRTATIVALRSIARMGRKAGVCLMAITQSGSLDVFDSHVRRNISNTLLFRSEHTVPEAWRLHGVKLSDVLPGWAYSVRHAGMVQFREVPRPQLPQPVVDTTGIVVEDWPTTGRLQPVAVVAAGCEPVVSRLESCRQPTAEEAATMRQLYAAGWSLNRLCREFYGYKDDDVLGFVRGAVFVAE